MVEPISALLLNAAELEIGTVTFVGESGEIEVPDVSYDEKYERASLNLAEKASPGFYTVEIAYTGSINDQLRGLYRSVYTDAEGNDHTIATSQCQATDARRVLPCWDEPDFKATFKTTIVAPHGLEAYSNGKELARTVLADGRVEFEFAETMPMSTYLLAFTVGPFEATDPVDFRGVPTRIIVPVGNLALTEYALDAAVWCLEYLSDYYDIPYPGDKLDHIAIPDFAGRRHGERGPDHLPRSVSDSRPQQGDPGGAGEKHRGDRTRDRPSVVRQPGDSPLVGGRLAQRGLRHLHGREGRGRVPPEWNRWLSFQVGAKAWAHGTDHLASTRPIEFEVQSPPK